MIRRAPLALVLVMALFLGACEAPRFVAEVTQFHKLPGAAPEPTFMLVARDSAKGATLQFDTYARTIIHNLESRGYRQVGRMDEAEYVVLVDYGVDAGTTEVYPVPVYGHYSDQFRRVHGVNEEGETFSAHVYDSGGYEPIGIAEQVRTVYKRTLQVDIVEAAAWRRGQTVKRYEGRVVNIGEDSEITRAIPLMIQALFLDFPGPSGATQTVVFPAPS